MSKSLRVLQREEADLSARVQSMRSGGYLASAAALADRLARTRETISRIQAHQLGALERKVLVTPSNFGQFGQVADSHNGSHA